MSDRASISEIMSSCCFQCYINSQPHFKKHNDVTLMMMVKTGKERDKRGSLLQSERP